MVCYLQRLEKWHGNDWFCMTMLAHTHQCTSSFRVKGAISVPWPRALNALRTCTVKTELFNCGALFSIIWTYPLLQKKQRCVGSLCLFPWKLYLLLVPRVFEAFCCSLIVFYQYLGYPGPTAESNFFPGWVNYYLEPVAIMWVFFLGVWEVFF